MASSYLCLSVLLFAVACKITTAVSTTARPMLTTEIEILSNDELTQQLESHLEKDMDIVEIHIQPNTSIGIIDHNGIIKKTHMGQRQPLRNTICLSTL